MVSTRCMGVDRTGIVVLAVIVEEGGSGDSDDDAIDDDVEVRKAELGVKGGPKIWKLRGGEVEGFWK
ncbi:hypothetical protein Ancab_003303 [Ancistrocladus abbreviatus]